MSCSSPLTKASLLPNIPVLPTRTWQEAKGKGWAVKLSRQQSGCLWSGRPYLQWVRHSQETAKKSLGLPKSPLFWGQRVPCFLSQMVYLHAEHATLPWKVNIKAFFLHTTIICPGHTNHTSRQTDCWVALLHFLQMPFFWFVFFFFFLVSQDFFV